VLNVQQYVAFDNIVNKDMSIIIIINLILTQATVSPLPLYDK